MAELAERHVPELGPSTWNLSAMTITCIGALWTHTRPSPSILAAYDADPTLAARRLDFSPALYEALATLITGVLARASD